MLSFFNDWDPGKYARINQAPKEPPESEMLLKKFMDHYQQSLENPGISPTELQMQNAMGRQIAAQHALAASRAGVSPGLAARISSRGAQDAMSNTAFQTGILRAQEEQARRQLYGDWLQRLYQGKLQAETQRYGFDKQASASQNSLFGSLLGGLGAIGGLLVGGPAGAVAGSAAGG